MQSNIKNMTDLKKISDSFNLAVSKGLTNQAVSDFEKWLDAAYAHEVAREYLANITVVTVSSEWDYFDTYHIAHDITPHTARKMFADDVYHCIGVTNYTVYARDFDDADIMQMASDARRKILEMPLDEFTCGGAPSFKPKHPARLEYRAEINNAVAWLRSIDVQLDCFSAH